MKQIPTKTFLKYVHFIGLVFIRKDGWHHDLYDYPDGHPNGKLNRPLGIRTNYKDIPLTHIHTCLISAGKTKSDFNNWLQSPKK